MKKLLVRAEKSNLGRVLMLVDEELESAGCSMKSQMQVDVAVEEMFINVASYAYAPGQGDVEVLVGTVDDPEGRKIKIVLSDRGKPWNPLEHKAPDVTLSAEERQIGGLGIFMARKNMDDMLYEFRDGRNVLTMLKKIS